MSQRSLLPRADGGGSKDLWNVGKLLPDYMALQPRRQPSLYSPPWEPQILRTVTCLLLCISKLDFNLSSPFLGNLGRFTLARVYLNLCLKKMLFFLMENFGDPFLTKQIEAETLQPISLRSISSHFLLGLQVDFPIKFCMNSYSPPP
jgi:hypothetical protein